MQSDNSVKDIMVGVFDFPHIPYWFTISQAIKIIRVSFLDTKKFPDPMVMLVFDEKYNLMGTLMLKDILRGVEAQSSKQDNNSGCSEDVRSVPSLEWDAIFGEEAKKLAEKPVSEIMAPVRHFVEPGDPIAKSAYLMVEHDLVLLPVLENQKKLVGLVRMIEVFDEMSRDL